MKKILPVILILAIFALFLVFIWFKDGFLLGTAESQIGFYDLTRFYDQVKLAWSDTNPGLGFVNGIVTAFAPTFFVLSQLEKIGVSNYIIEALFFWFLLVSSGVGIILLTQELFPKLPKKYLLIAGIFYWFNALSLVNIWNRFLYNYIALWALLPIATAFYIRGTKRKNYLYVFAVGITSVVFSLGLSNPVFNIVLWFVLSFITLFYIFATNIKKDKVFYLLFYFLNLGYFCLINLWWIGQVIRNLFLGKYTEELSSFFQNSVSLSTLSSSSQNLGDLIYLFRLMHKSFFETPFTEWAKLFLGFGFVTVEFLFTSIILFFIFKKRKNINVLFLGLFFLIGIFLAKGNNPPFGNLFEFLFTNITFLQFFRNPFEKFGFIIPLAASPLFAAGLEDLASRFQKKVRVGGYIIFLFILIGLFGYPFWSGLVFTGMFPPNNDYAVGFKVKVPDYYKSADNFLQSNGANFRFLGSPFNGQGVTYNWEKGYQGIETSMWLFSTPHVMFSTTILYFDKIADQLEELLMKEPDFYKVMNILNAKYLLVRSDIDFHERNMKDPQKIKELLSKLYKEGKLKEEVVFGKLEFWENPFWSDKTIYPAANLIKSLPDVKLVDFTLIEASSAAAAYTNSNPNIDKMVSLEVIHPTKPIKESKPKPNIYNFDFKDTGLYELIGNLKVLRVDDAIVESKPILRNDGRYSLGNFNLEKGIHEVELVIENSDNIVSKDANINEYTIVGFDPYSKYPISFDYSIKDSQKIKVNILADNDQIKNGQQVPSYVRDLSGNPNEQFNTFKDTYEPRSSASSIRIYFTPEAKDNLIIRDMNIKRNLNPEVFFIKKEENIIQKVPTLSYIKISPTRYTIHVEDSRSPFVLVFSSTFSPGWEVVFPDGSKAKNHFLANSYANGWVIDKQGNYDLILNFTLQQGLDTDSLISITTLSGGIIVVFIAFVKSLIRRKGMS